MARLSPARRVALALVSARRRRDGRIRDIARTNEGMVRLEPLDRALAFRLAVGATAAKPVLDAKLDECLRRPKSLEPRVRDALEVAAYELLYLDTPPMAAVSQGVELVRSVAPRASGMANAVLRRLAREVRPVVAAARERVMAGEGPVTTEDLSLAAGLPHWMVGRVRAERGIAFARGLCLAQMAPAPVYVATNGLRHDASELESLLAAAGLEPQAVAGLKGSFALGEPAGLAATGMVERVELAVADLSAQLVCRLAQPSGRVACERAVPDGRGDTEGASGNETCSSYLMDEAGDDSHQKAAGWQLLEIGQGRATKSLLMATALGACHPVRIVGVDSVGSKVRLSRERMERAGLGDVVSCVEWDGTRLADAGLPDELADTFDVVLVDAPCSGTGTMRRHPELPASIDAKQIKEIVQLQLAILTAAAERVAPGGTLLYSTCSVMRAEDEDVVEAFLASGAGAAFEAQPVSAAPSLDGDEALAALVRDATGKDGYLLTTPAPTGGDGHFCARLVRRKEEGQGVCRGRHP